MTQGFKEHRKANPCVILRPPRALRDVEHSGLKSIKTVCKAPFPRRNFITESMFIRVESFQLYSEGIYGADFSAVDFALFPLRFRTESTSASRTWISPFDFGQLVSRYAEESTVKKRPSPHRFLLRIKGGFFRTEESTV